VHRSSRELKGYRSSTGVIQRYRYSATGAVQGYRGTEVVYWFRRCSGLEQTRSSKGIQGAIVVQGYMVAGEV